MVLTLNQADCFCNGRVITKGYGGNGQQLNSAVVIAAQNESAAETLSPRSVQSLRHCKKRRSKQIVWTVSGTFETEAFIQPYRGR